MATDTTLTATNLTAATHLAKPASAATTGFAAAGADTVSGTFDTTKLAYEVEVITIGNSGGKVTHYYISADATTLTATGLTNANLAKVIGVASNTDTWVKF